jgi:phosphatidate cytidylyltransferase
VNWKSFSSRLLLVIVTFPVLGVLIFLAPGLHLLPFALAVVAASVIGATETRGLFTARGIITAPYLAPILAGTLPLSAWLEVAGMIPSGWVRTWPAVCIGIILVRAILQKDPRRIQEFLFFTSSSVFILLYPSYFLSWVVRLIVLPQPSLSILLFLALVFGNDMAAYFAGSLWGGSTQLNFAISPQKSAVGFIAGILGTGIVYTVFRLAVPSLLPASLMQGIVFCLVMSISVIFGDLVESGLKRSAHVKDSGIIIPGRGGLLDSIDSMLLSAPLFYGLMRLFG